MSVSKSVRLGFICLLGFFSLVEGKMAVQSDSPAESLSAQPKRTAKAIEASPENLISPSGTSVVDSPSQAGPQPNPEIVPESIVPTHPPS